MNMLQLLKAEILHRKLNFVFSFIAVVTAATLFVAGPTILRGYQRDSDKRLTEMQQETDQTLGEMEEKAVKDLAHLDKRTKRIMRDLGRPGGRRRQRLEEQLGRRRVALRRACPGHEQDGERRRCDGRTRCTLCSRSRTSTASSTRPQHYKRTATGPASRSRPTT